MDKKTQQSLVNTISSIVNKNVLNEQSVQAMQYDFAVLITEALNQFEELFQTKINKQDQDILSEVAVMHMLTPGAVKNINLNESIETIINENTPEEVFIYILEGIGSTIGGGIGTMFGGPVGGAIGGAIGSGAESLIGGLVSKGQGSGQSGVTGDGRPTGTEDPFGLLGQVISYAKQSTAGDPNALQYSGYVSESTQMLSKKKKKVFKIIYQKGGVKKKTTAVSHKGVARIISDKDHFRVFDERNHDVTQQFKTKKH